jgi:hypothetical protein
MGKGAGGGSQQTTSTSYQTNIPQYAQPYVENMLGATQKQLFNTREVAGTDEIRRQTGVDELGNATYDVTPAKPGYTELTGFKQYQPYSSNPSDYVAGFSPLQNQGFNDLANMSVARQIGMGTDVANRASAGAMDTAAPAYGYGAQGMRAGQAGQDIGVPTGLALGAQGVDIGQQGMQAGMGYGQQAQNPYAIQGYMNPYLQASLQPQLAEIQRQYGITGAQQQGNATQAGAFGGTREALMAAENQRNKNMAMNQVIGQGYNTAYDVANRNMQAASQLGMQGAGVGLQGVGAGLQGGNMALAGTAQGMQGAGIGLQGVQGAQNAYGLGIQGANALNNLGTAQYNQEMGIAQARLGAGAQQQQYQQQIINQGVQDYANAQQYPLMQLGTMSNMLRGLPMQAATSNQYMAAPNQLTQGIGAAGSLAYMNSAMNKGYAKGGILQAYDVGGEVESDLRDMPLQRLQQYLKQSASPEAKRMAQEIIREKMMEEQFAKQQPQRLASGGITGVQRFQNRGEVELVPGRGTGRVDSDLTDFVTQFNELERRGRNPAPTQSAPPSRDSGIVSGRVTTPSTLYGLSGSGRTGLSMPNSGVTTGVDENTGDIVAAPRESGEGVRVPSYQIAETAPRTLPEVTVQANEERPQTVAPTGIMQVGTGDGNLLGKPPRQYENRDEAMAELLAEKKKYGLTANEGAEEFRSRAMAERANLGDEAARQRSMRMAEFFASWGSMPGNTISAGMNALKNTIPNMIADDREQARARKEADKIIFEIDQAIRAEKLGDFAEAGRIKEKAADRAEKFNEKLLALQIARETNASRVSAANVGALNKQEQTRLNELRIANSAYNSAMGQYRSAKDKAADIFKEPDVATAKMVLSTLKPTTPENKAKIDAASQVYNSALLRSTNILKPFVNDIVRAGAAKEVEHNPEEFLYPFGKPTSTASNNGFRIIPQP